MEIQSRRSDGSFVAIINGSPYHVTQEDPLYTQARVAGAGAPIEHVTIAAPSGLEVSTATSLTFAQLLIGLVDRRWITEAEGEAWLAGVLPSAVLAVIAALPADQRFAAKARAARPSSVLRSDPLVNALAVAQGKSQDQLDTFFSVYSQA